MDYFRIEALSRFFALISLADINYYHLSVVVIRFATCMESETRYSVKTAKRTN